MATAFITQIVQAPQRMLPESIMLNRGRPLHPRQMVKFLVELRYVDIGQNGNVTCRSRGSHARSSRG